MLLESGQLTLLDFGSVGRMDAVTRSALIRLILTFQRGDPVAATDALLQLVEPPAHLDEWRLERAVGQFMIRHLAPGVPPDAQMVPDLFRLLSDFGLSALPEVAAAFRAIATLDGTLTAISPGFNAIAQARTFGETYMREQLRPKALGESLASELLAILPMIRRLPRRLDKLTEQLETGRLSLNVRALSDTRDQVAMSRLLNRFLAAIIACTAGVIAAVMLGQAGGPAVTSSVTLYQLIGYAFLIAALILALRVLVSVFRTNDTSGN
jgi:ubiquinone biosynthesis protein